eukprot:TRINITY_DN72737_c0_g1_i1.p1 TRINITY_DN72737_c0_g1~~TRINITY_DN72737_c0_g1_i1.p1  ORF type:complete len:384 (-),score=44.81 TRINITY_DN72737_c0_g1_i1:227-1378(-)
MMPSVTVGIMFMVGSGVTVTMLLLLGKIMQSAGWPYYNMLSMSSAMAFGIFALLAGLCRAPFPESKSLKWILIRGISSTATFASTVAAVRLGAPAGDVAALGGVNTVFAALLGRVFLGEPLQLSHIVAVLCCLAGGVLISKPEFLFGVAGSSVPIFAHLMALVSGFFAAVTSISARKAGKTSPWFLNMSATFTGSFAFAALPLTGFLDEPDLSVLQSRLYLGGICIFANALGFVIAIGATTGGSMWCPAAVSATVYVAARLTLGYLADVLILGISVDPLSLCGATLMLGAVVVMACARKPAEDLVVQVSEASEAGQPSQSLEDETSSLASFIATEFVSEKGHQGRVHQRRRATAGTSDSTPAVALERTMFGVFSPGPPGPYIC